MRLVMRLMIMSAVSACAAPRPTPEAASNAAIRLREARDRFAEAHALCIADDGATWGGSLCGPMLLVDPRTRAVVANQADREGRLRLQDGVFVGVLPAETNAANTS